MIAEVIDTLFRIACFFRGHKWIRRYDKVQIVGYADWYWTCTRYGHVIDAAAEVAMNMRMEDDVLLPQAATVSSCRLTKELLPHWLRIRCGYLPSPACAGVRPAWA